MFRWKYTYGVICMMVAAGILLGCHMGSRAVSVIAEEAREEMRMTVVIDPGHGGIDGGATSCTGKLESGYNLEISLRLRDLLHLLGLSTRMVRTTDTSVYTAGDTIAAQKMSDLKQRVKITEDQKNSLLISIHQNNFSDARYSGAQVFYPKTQGSRELAETLQTALVSALNPGSKRRAKQAEGLYVMEHVTCPGVLVECGFLSNPEEEAKLCSPDYQKKLCCVIACTVSSFRGIYPNT